MVTEMFKVRIGCALDIMNKIFEIDNRNDNFRHDFLIKRHNIRSVYYDTKAASFIGPKIWDTLPSSCKDATLLKSFQENLKRWIPDNCPCRLYKFIFNMYGFFNNNFLAKLQLNYFFFFLLSGKLGIKVLIWLLLSYE